MKYFTLILLIHILFNSSLRAEEDAFSTNWRFNDRRIEFENSDATGWVSSSCLHSNDKKACEAISLSKNSSLAAIPIESFSGGKNPGSVLCRQLKNTHVVIGVDDKGDHNSFCFFSDGSVISNGSLVAQARKNDELKKKKKK